MADETPDDIYQRIADEWSALAARLGFVDYRDMLMSLTPDVQRIVDALEARSRAWLQRNGAPEGTDFEYRSYQGHQNDGFWHWMLYTHDCSHTVYVLIMRTVAARRWGVDPSLVKATSYEDRATRIQRRKPRFDSLPGGVGFVMRRASPSDPDPVVECCASLSDFRPAGDLATTWFYTPPHTLFQAGLEHDLQRHVMKALAEPGAHPRPEDYDEMRMRSDADWAERHQAADD